MEFIIGAFTAMLFFCCLFLAYWMGQRQTKTPSKVETLSEDAMKQREQIKRYNEHFQKLMRYDTDTALQRKKV